MIKTILIFTVLFGISSPIYANIAQKLKLYAIIIGIGDYPNAKFSLKYAKNDATAIYQKLKAQVGYTYKEGHITLLNQPEQTTPVAIQQAFGDIKDHIKPEDVFTLYIAGEADHADDEYYLLTSQSKDFSAEQLQRTGLSATQLKKLIIDIPATNKLVLLDTSMSDSVMKASDLFATHHIKACQSGMILTAGRYTLNHGFRGHSVFTYAFIDALSGIADLNKNGFIENDELAEYVRAIVPAIAKYEFDRRQTPYIDQCGENLKFKKIPKE